MIDWLIWQHSQFLRCFNPVHWEGFTDVGQTMKLKEKGNESIPIKLSEVRPPITSQTPITSCVLLLLGMASLISAEGKKGLGLLWKRLGWKVACIQ